MNVKALHHEIMNRKYDSETAYSLETGVVSLIDNIYVCMFFHITL